MDPSFDEFGAPISGPLPGLASNPFADPVHDPLWDQLEALENSIQPLPNPGQDPFSDLIEGLDWQGYAAGRLEASIETPPVAVPPPPSSAGAAPHTPAVVESESLETMAGSTPLRSPHPFGLPQSSEQRRNDMPPPRTRPTSFSDGLKPPSYHPRGGCGAGIRNTDEQELMRWCAEVNEPVRQEDCQGCEQWGDHGAGLEQCYHEWLAENKSTEGEKEQDRAGES